MKKRHLFFLVIFLLSLITVYGNGLEEEHEEEPTIPWPIWTVVGYGSVLFGVLVFLMVKLKKRMKSKMKQFVYSLVVLTVGFVSLYLIITTIFLNVTSETGGPVHWHADYEVWACGEKLTLIDPKFPSNKVGTPVLHDHGDNRIHVEGVISNMLDASLHAFFKIIGGELTKTTLGFPTNEKYRHYENDMLCASGNPGILYVFVNGEEVDDFAEYVLAPYETIPPGDTIKIIFTDEPADEIDTYTSQYGRERKI